MLAEEMCRTAWALSYGPSNLTLRHPRHKIRHGGSAFGRSRRLHCRP
jgi:hypothetical protein